MAYEIKVESLKPFTMVGWGNSCTLSGTPIADGEVCYAETADHARNGMAICEAEYKRLTAPPEPPNPAVPESETSQRKKTGEAPKG